MRTLASWAGIPLLALAVAGAAPAQDLFVYPESGQSAEQQDKDKYECHAWAKRETGFDPMARPTTTTPAPQQNKPGVVGTAARGAAVGAVGGAIGGDAGKGAAIGAASGGLIGGMRNRDQRRAQDQWAQEQVSQYEQQRSQFNRAYSACLGGRGYTVR
jgi:uncharacterized protein YcfJ